MIKQFFFTGCVILLTGSILLIWDSPPESFLRQDANLVNKLPSADTYMINIESFKFSSDGSKKYSLTASEMSLFNDQAEVRLIKPKFMAFEIGDKQSEVNVIANQGLISKSSQSLKFMGDVKASWQASKGPSILTAGTFIYLIEKDSASATNGIQLTTPDSSISGETFSANFQNEILKIESGVRATHDAI